MDLKIHKGISSVLLGGGENWQQGGEIRYQTSHGFCDSGRGLKQVKRLRRRKFPVSFSLLSPSHV